MVSFCEDSLIGGSNIHVKKGVRLIICSFRYLVKSLRPFLSHDNHSANLVSVVMYCDPILARPDDTSSRSLAFRPLHHG